MGNASAPTSSYSTAAILAEVQARGIPVHRLEGDFYQLGEGSRQKRFWRATTSSTSSIGVYVAQQKALAGRILAAAGIPVAPSRVVVDAEMAVEAARSIGYPVIVKPQAGRKGQGVSMPVRSDDEARAAFAAANAITGGTVLVEGFVAGRHYRVTVIGGRAAAVAERVAASVTGDGVHNIEDLVASANADPRRRLGHEGLLTRIALTPETDMLLERQGLTRRSRPDMLRHVELAATSNLSTGGTASDRSDEVHPANAAMAVAAAAAVGLDVAGVDLIVPDIAKPLEEQGGVILEVNEGPGLRIHISPAEGDGRDMAGLFLDALMDGSGQATIPIIAVLDADDASAMVASIEDVLGRTGQRLGVAAADGFRLDGHRFSADDMRGQRGARALVGNPLVDVAVLELAATTVLRDGVGYDRVDVAAVRSGAAAAGRVLVERVAATGTAVLDADDPAVRALAGSCAGAAILCSAGEGQDQRGADAVREHYSSGAAGVLLERSADGISIVLREGDAAPVLLASGLVSTDARQPLAQPGVAVVAVAAAAWAAGVEAEIIAAALSRLAVTSPAAAAATVE